MKQRDEVNARIIDYVDRFYNDFGETPTVRDIAAGTGISLSTVHRYLSALKETGEVGYNGRRSVCTKRMELEVPTHSMPVLGYVSCGAGQEEVQEIIEYIRMPESLVGKGEFFALIAKGYSMIDAGVHPDDYVVVRRQQNAKVGDIVVALAGGANNLKVLDYDSAKGQYFLRSCNPDKQKYPNIYPDDLQIQGVAVCVTHQLFNMA